MSLVFDIETIGEDFDGLDDITKETLTKWIKKESADEGEYEKSLEDIKNGLGFSPLTGQIVAIGVLDSVKNKGTIYFQSPGSEGEDFEEGGYKFRPCSEKEMLEKFWDGAKHYDEFVSFNGRGFDAPFLVVRSAIHKIKPSVDLMAYRYIESQKYGAKHIDLLDQLSFYGALRRKGGLHLWSRAFGIKSPKEDGVTGDDVAKLFKEGRYEDIARYNVGDLEATKELYEYWREYIKSF
ncbi:TPA: 3'-5' exonuclease [Patescibacteria group bacterium]|nr:MAG: hypothetical protein UT71_C0007G0003 [Parcubacteria group bacterium GW2011_GWF2_40_10]KKR47755.1 MAG: hypothetical protein UT83_C0004G0003 [Parcubacteria group bacterium GW2011_GWA2_40_143]KKR60089.1 MAG: hypothetical protein UT97_C0005G0003 [Parcubacteria group bacterium GW2011_GWC2_40_31]KKR75481.1 MAG: hypothetical protein UU18_C0004G0003 [Parcubacteria group bacterium GW2011_GWB2_40_8]KKR77700.1 MAG: hypothetical protein UU20_C0002G0022 [Parcubacteria group bacterium GW2011_GWE2_40_